MSRLRATCRGGAKAIMQTLLAVNLADVATRAGLRKPRLVELATCDEKAKPATTEELVTLCAAISGGLLRYEAEDDAIVTDAINSIRAALIGRDLAFLGDAVAIRPDVLDRFRAGAEVPVNSEDLDRLAAVLFEGRLRIAVGGELVAVGYVAPPILKRKRRPLPFPTQANDDFLVNRPISIGPNGLAPVAMGSEAPGFAILKSEPPRAGYERLQAKLKTISGIDEISR